MRLNKKHSHISKMYAGKKKRIKGSSLKWQTYINSMMIIRNKWLNRKDNSKFLMSIKVSPCFSSVCNKKQNKKDSRSKTITKNLGNFWTIDVSRLINVKSLKTRRSKTKNNKQLNNKNVLIEESKSTGTIIDQLTSSRLNGSKNFRIKPYRQARPRLATSIHG